MTLAFLVLGFLVGNVTGLSASPVATALVPALFALAGGSVLAFLKDLSAEDRKLAGRAIIGFSVGCLSGIYLAIVVTSRQVLGPTSLPEEHGTYLRSSEQSAIDEVDQRVRRGDISADQGYKELHDILKNTT